MTMEHETQSGDRVEHKGNEMEYFLVQQEIFYKNHIRPAIRNDVSEEFQRCVKPIHEKLGKIETRLLVKTIAFTVLILIALFLTLSLTIP